MAYHLFWCQTACKVSRHSHAKMKIEGRHAITDSSGSAEGFPFSRDDFILIPERVAHSARWKPVGVDRKSQPSQFTVSAMIEGCSS